MTTPKKYWSEVREIEASLPHGVYTTVLDVPSLTGSDKPGTVTPMARSHAAICIFEGTHRVATAEEVERYRLEQARRRSGFGR